jgi:subtilisin family serine protease
VIIFNNNPSPIKWTLRCDQDPWSSTYDFPLVVALTQRAGVALLGKTGAVTVTSDPDDYAVYNGTSMATPHVVGAAALIWSMAPEATAKDVVAALTATAIDRGPKGPDPAYGAGVIDILAAAKRLAPRAFGSTPSTTPTTGPSTGRPMGKRGRG